MTQPLRLVAYITGNLVASTAAALVVWRLVERRFLALKDVWDGETCSRGRRLLPSEAEGK